MLNSKKGITKEDLMVKTYQHLFSLLGCPLCHGKLTIQPEQKAVKCQTCQEIYEMRDGIPVFINEKVFNKIDEPGGFPQYLERMKFWGRGYAKRIKGDQSCLYEMPREELVQEIEAKRVSWEKERLLSVTEVNPDDIGGLDTLLIGCGGGREAAFFAYFEAHCIAMDLTFEAALSTQYLTNKIQKPCVAIQADARSLPICSNSLDLVYSNGVLHHSPQIGKSIDEIYRVLKPGGKAAIMVYATHSMMWYRIRLGSLLRGYWTKKQFAEWLSRSTECDWRTEGLVNKYTQTFTVREIERLFEKFSSVRIRRGRFYWSSQAKIDTLLKNILTPFGLVRRMEGPSGKYLSGTLNIHLEK